MHDVIGYAQMQEEEQEQQPQEQLRDVIQLPFMANVKH